MSGLEIVDNEKMTPEDILSLIENIWSELEWDDEELVLNASNRENLEHLNTLVDEVEYEKFESEEDADRFFELEAEIEEAIENFSKIDSDDSDLDIEDEISDLNEKQLEAATLLDEVFELWSEITSDDSGEYRQPADDREVKKSRKLLRNAFIKGGDHPFIKERIDELEAVLDAYDEFHQKDYGVSIWGPIIVILALFGSMFYFGSMNSFETLEYNDEWFTTNKTTWLTMKSFIEPAERAEFAEKVRIPRGTKLEPLGQKGTYFFKVKAPNGQIGFVYMKDLLGYKYVSLRAETELFNQPFSEQKEIGIEGDKGEILQFREVLIPGRLKDKQLFAQVKLDNGGSFWVKDYKLNHLIKTNILDINQTLSIVITQNVIDTKIVGNSLEQVEKTYFPAVSHLNLKGQNIAYFPHLEPVFDGKHYRSLILTLDNNNIVTGYTTEDEGKTKFYDQLPLASFFMDTNVGHALNTNLYFRSENSEFAFWSAFKDWHWSTMIIGWLVDIILFIIMIGLIFSIPRLVSSPFINLTLRTRFLSNGMVRLINFLFFGFVSYCFILIIAVSSDTFWIPAGITTFLFFAWYGLHTSTITYNRCPECHRFNAADETGVSKGSKVKQIERGTYDTYNGSSVSGNTTTRHYTRHSKRNVKIYQNYTDHLQCRYCGAVWDVQRKELEKEWNEYD